MARQHELVPRIVFDEVDEGRQDERPRGVPRQHEAGVHGAVDAARVVDGVRQVRGRRGQHVVENVGDGLRARESDDDARARRRVVEGDVAAGLGVEEAGVKGLERKGVRNGMGEGAEGAGHLDELQLGEVAAPAEALEGLVDARAADAVGDGRQARELLQLEEEVVGDRAVELRCIPIRVNRSADAQCTCAGGDCKVGEP